MEKQLLNILLCVYYILFKVFDILFVTPWLDSDVQEQKYYHEEELDMILVKTIYIKKCTMSKLHNYFC